MTGSDLSSGAGHAGRPGVEVSISIRTILLVAASWPSPGRSASIGDVLLLFFVSVFSIAVLSPVVDAMERRLPWGRALCATVLVLGIVILVGVVVLVFCCRRSSTECANFSRHLPRLVDKARHSDLGGLINGGKQCARRPEGAHQRDHQRGGQGVGRPGPRRGVRFRGGHARLLGHLPDALRADRRAAREERGSAACSIETGGSATSGSRTGSSRRPPATCSATWRSR